MHPLIRSTPLTLTPRARVPLYRCMCLRAPSLDVAAWASGLGFLRLTIPRSVRRVRPSTATHSVTPPPLCPKTGLSTATPVFLHFPPLNEGLARVRIRTRGGGYSPCALSHVPIPPPIGPSRSRGAQWCSGVATSLGLGSEGAQALPP